MVNDESRIMLYVFHAKFVRNEIIGASKELNSFFLLFSPQFLDINEYIIDCPNILVSWIFFRDMKLYAR